VSSSFHLDTKRKPASETLCSLEFQTTDKSPKTQLSQVTNYLVKELRDFSPQENYTVRATAACRRSECQLLWTEGVVWVAQRIPTAVNLGFLDRSRYFSVQVDRQLFLRV
jgi:hypothetical protein